MRSRALGLDKRKIDVEARKSIRSPLLVLEVKGRHYDKIFIGYTQNVSRDGLFLSARQALKVGDRFPVEFILPDNTTKVSCTCQVVWTKKFRSQTGSTTGLGVRFLDLDETNRRVIEDWVIRSENKEDSESDEA